MTLSRVGRSANARLAAPIRQRARQPLRDTSATGKGHSPKLELLLSGKARVCQALQRLL